MNLLSLILIAMGLLVGLCVFYVAWQFSSGKWNPEDQAAPHKKEPDESKESKDSPGS